MKVLALLVLVAVSAFLVSGQSPPDASSDSPTAPPDDEVTGIPDDDEDTSDAPETSSSDDHLRILENS
ncbi:hypothetical protein VULLAG_LOCUS7184 [Vulpes lagopus]